MNLIPAPRSKAPITVLLLARAVNFTIMNTDPLLAVSGAQHLPDAWRTEVESQLSGNEEILAW
ncbi:MAG: hypothetical protein Q8K43_08375, partial [Sulfurimicrobium sp.]|nr:hypothetical protein [Sulfurimicrobium sp.]